jgi:hypothetical protein
MNAKAFPTKKIKSILPRLGSPHDGEVVASARAIERTLRATGRDWHDLVRAVEGSTETPRKRCAPQKQQRQKNESPPPHGLDWRGQCYQILATGCTRWENDFCRGLLRDWRGPLTPKQIACLQRIFELRVASFWRARA